MAKNVCQLLQHVLNFEYATLREREKERDRERERKRDHIQNATNFCGRQYHQEVLCCAEIMKFLVGVDRNVKLSSLTSLLPQKQDHIYNYL